MIMEQRINETKEGLFVIDSDTKAEWALEKIKAAQEDRDRLLDIVKYKEAELAEKKAKIEADYDNDTGYLKQLLAAYMQTVPTRKTKTQSTYKLVTGSLVMKQGGYEYKRDETSLCEWLENNGYSDFVKVDKKAAWGELKKGTTVNEDGSVCISETGEIVEGVTAARKPDEFDVKF